MRHTLARSGMHASFVESAPERVVISQVVRAGVPRFSRSRPVLKHRINPDPQRSFAPPAPIRSLTDARTSFQAKRRATHGNKGSPNSMMPIGAKYRAQPAAVVVSIVT